MKTWYFLLVVLVIASGCVGTVGNRSPNDAIVINEFSLDPKVLEPDDTASFFLDVENVGGTTARCVTAELYGIESWYNQMSQPLAYARPWRTGGIGFNYANGQLAFSYWDPNGGFVNFAYSRQPGMGLSTYVNVAWNQFTSRFCTAAGGWSQYEEVKYFDSLSPAVPAQNKPGQSFTTQWLLRPPVLPEGVHTNYPVTARVSYLYTSNAQINLQAFNKAEAERREVLGQAGDIPITVENSYFAPIQVVVVRGKNPIIVNQRQPNYELVNYLIEFQNVGNGWPLPLESDIMSNQGANGFIFATAELNGPGAYFYDCLGAHEGTEIFVSGNAIQNLVKLRSDRRAPFGCTIAIDRVQWADNPMGTISLTFKLWYRYYTDATIGADVLGLQQSG